MFKHNLKAVLNSQRPDKDGKYPLRIRMTIKRVVTYHATNIMLKEDQLVNGEVVKHPNKALLNTYIRDRINEIEKALLEQSITGEETTRKKKNITLTFGEYAKKKIESWKATQTKVTTDHKTSYLNKFLAFNPDIKLKDVNKEVIAEYEAYCRSIGNINNTVWSATKFVKTILNAAVEDGVLLKNPLKGFKGAKYSNPMRTILSEGEIKLIEGFADNRLNNPKLTNVANWFLLSAYTGLRFADMQGFTGLVNGRVLVKTQKTGEVVSIFATEQIKKAVARIDKPVFSNQKSNEYLGAIMAILGIDKKITFHSGRHFFAVNFITKGGRVEILQKLLGHNIIATTQIYAKISNPMLDQEMRKVFGV